MHSTLEVFESLQDLQNCMWFCEDVCWAFLHSFHFIPTYIPRRHIFYRISRLFIPRFSSEVAQAAASSSNDQPDNIIIDKWMPAGWSTAPWIRLKMKTKWVWSLVWDNFVPPRRRQRDWPRLWSTWKHCEQLNTWIWPCLVWLRSILGTFEIMTFYLLL